MAGVEIRRHNKQQRILALATDFPAVWRDFKILQRERTLVLSIEDVTLIEQLSNITFRQTQPRRNGT